jgi:predicted enzyme related to lactoylglutathione lyase
MKLKGIMIGSENPKQLGEFYAKIFGDDGWHQDDWYGFQSGGGSLMIGPHSEVHGKSQMPERLIVIIESDDVKTEAGRIKETGATVVAEPYQPDKDKDPRIWLATFADPDGNYFQLSTPWQD